MLKHIRLVEGIGQFDQVAQPQIELSPLSLVYAENARGKTTLVSVFRSLQSGDPVHIRERKRLGSAKAPQVVLTFTDESNAIVFQNGAWNALKSNIAIFDETFVNDNIYSGMVVQSPQREGLHGLIVGARGVTLLRGLQTEVDAVEEHNVKLRKLGSAIPTKLLHGLTVDQFCDLPKLDNIGERIEEARKSVSAGQQEEAIMRMKDLEQLPSVPISPDAIRALLSEQIENVTPEAERRVSAHLERLGNGGEAWVAQGHKIQQEHEVVLGSDCPYCAQGLQFSDLAHAYSLHFSETYHKLKERIQRTIDRLEELYGSESISHVGSQVSENNSKLLFWSEFIDLELLEFDFDTYSNVAAGMRTALAECLQKKATAPLEDVPITNSALNALTRLSEQCELIDRYNGVVKLINQKSAAVKEALTVTSLNTLRDDLSRLEGVEQRHEPSISAKCDAYLAERSGKKATESRRSSKKRALDTHLQNVFPTFQEAINQYLRRLNAGFRIDGVKSLNTRRGPSCIYSVVIDNHPNHPVAVNADTVGEPSFKTVLSTSDRNTLALAVFLASIAQDDDKQQKIALIDDPINSLDEHRAFATVSAIRRLAAEVAQVLVFSHNRPLVCHLWESPGQIGRTAIEIARSGSGSIIRLWDVSTHGISEHDKRHAKLREYRDNQMPNAREVAEAIRPTVEAFLRVAYPEQCPPGTLLGRFRTICRQFVGTSQEVLPQADIDELATLTEYGNLFHHDTNPAWQTADINDAELLSFVHRAIDFTKRN